MASAGEEESTSAVWAVAADTPAVEKRKPVFVKVETLLPDTHGHNLTVKVLDSKPVNAGKPRRGGRPMSLAYRPQPPSRVHECLVGDETGCIKFTARNEQVDIMKPGTTVILRNAKIEMLDKREKPKPRDKREKPRDQREEPHDKPEEKPASMMRLAVDKWGRIEVTEPADFVVLESKNLSEIEYELVDKPNA